jgi:hypothetical protein
MRVMRRRISAGLLGCHQGWPPVAQQGDTRATTRDTELSESERTWLNWRDMKKPGRSGQN